MYVRTHDVQLSSFYILNTKMTDVPEFLSYLSVLIVMGHRHDENSKSIHIPINDKYCNNLIDNFVNKFNLRNVLHF